MHREEPTEPSEGETAQWVINYWMRPGGTDRTMNTSYMIQDPAYDGVPSGQCPGYRSVAAIDNWLFHQRGFPNLLSPSRVIRTTDAINEGLSRDTGGTGTKRVDQFTQTDTGWAVEVTVGIPAELTNVDMDYDMTDGMDDDMPPPMPGSIDPGGRALIPPGPMSPEMVRRLRRMARLSRRQSNHSDSQAGSERTR
jgi:hypothetical protein